MDSQESQTVSDIERQQTEQALKELAPVARPVQYPYQCEICKKKWMKWFIISRIFKGFPRVRFCGKECRSKRHAV